jgi:hypothetical protein
MCFYMFFRKLCLSKTYNILSIPHSKHVTSPLQSPTGKCCFEKQSLFIVRTIRNTQIHFQIIYKNSVRTSRETHYVSATRDLQACSIVSQPTTLPRPPLIRTYMSNIDMITIIILTKHNVPPKPGMRVSPKLQYAVCLHQRCRRDLKF